MKQRSSDFPGVITCTPTDSLASLLLLIKQRRVHRLVVIDADETSGKKGRLVGIITLSDILRYIIASGDEPPTPAGPGQGVGTGVPSATSHLAVGDDLERPV